MRELRIQLVVKMPTGGLLSCDETEIIHKVYNIIHTNIMTLEFVEYWCHKAGGLAKQ